MEGNSAFMKTPKCFQVVIIAVALCCLPGIGFGAITSAKQSSDPGAPAIEFKDGELLVKFRRGIDAARVEQIKKRAGLRALKRYGRLRIHRMKISKSGLSVRQAAKLLNRMPDVLYAEPNYKVSTLAVPSDPRFSELWGMNNTGQTGGTADADVDALEAWDISTGDPGIVVAVIDTGVDYDHVDLAANIWVNPGEIPNNGIDDDGNGYIDDIHGIDTVNADGDPFDDNGHGTHTSGTIGGVGDNGIGVAGVNWNVRIMALKFLDAGGSGWISDAVECLDYAVMMKTTYGVNVRLTSNSWGGGGFSQAMEDAIQASNAADMLFIAAAGNSSSNNDLLPQYPANYEVPNVVSIAATDHNDDLAYFSCYGVSTVDLGAPGDSILSTTPGNTYSVYSGTSMATPHVAGAAALMWASDPAMSNLEVKGRLLATVDPVPALAGKVLSGGRLNVFNAMTCSPDTVDFSVSPEDGFTAEVGIPVSLSARLTACAFLTGATISAEFSNGDPAVPVADDGIAPDTTAGDGMYTGEWTSGTVGTITVTFTAERLGATYTASAAGEVVNFAGYYHDDTEPFGWIDITASGTPLNLEDDDNAYIFLPFTVSFYNVEYGAVSVGSNGNIYFENNWSDYMNSCIPSETGYVNTYIAPFWTDLDPSWGGQIYFEIQGVEPYRKVIVQYDNVPHYDTYETISFEVILHENSDNILMQFLDVDFGDPFYDFGATATVGLQRDDAYGQQYSCSEGSLSDQTAIRWYREAGPAPETSVSPTSLTGSSQPGDNAPSQDIEVWNSGPGTLSYSIATNQEWLYCAPASGVSDGERDSITVVFETAGLAEGEYTAIITVSDPEASNGPQYVEVTMTVTSAQMRLLSPANESVLYGPPTFSWTPGDGMNNVFAVDLSLEYPMYTYWSTYKNMRRPLYTTSWTPPYQLWNRIPSGTYVYWRVRGANTYQSPMTPTTSEEVWWFYKP